jgi:phosphohistidine phosphatase
LLLVGHNPGIEQLALALTVTPERRCGAARLKRLTQKFPTAALAVLDFEIASWRDSQAGHGSLVDYVRPKDLLGGGGGDD